MTFWRASALRSIQGVRVAGQHFDYRAGNGSRQLCAQACLNVFNGFRGALACDGQVRQPAIVPKSRALDGQRDPVHLTTS